MKRRNVRLLVHVCGVLLFVHCALASTQAKDTWTRVRSTNFLLVGNASEKEIREVAARLEQFHEAFTRLLTGFRFNVTTPTTVIVFKSAESFDPFKPVYQGKPGNVAGYFQSGEDVNYITLTTDRSADDPFHIIFHEYVHLLLHNTVRNVPPWLDEGLAEYYSTFGIVNGGHKILIGRIIPSHLLLLRSNPLLPLQTLLAVDRKSPYYNERDKTGVFYAESWALVHYLILGNERKRQRQLGTFLEWIQKGSKSDNAFQEAFHIDYQTLSNELRSYLLRHLFPEQIVSLSHQLRSSQEISSSRISEAEALAYRGDLLLHTDRLEDAEIMLNQALALDKSLPLAHAAMGVLRVRQKRFAEAITHLRKAEAANPTNYLIHYYHAFALSRSAMDESLTVSNYAAGTADTMRTELRQAIELNPRFAESYALLGFVNLVQEEQLDEAIELVRHAMSLAPDRDDYVFVLAQLYVRKQDFFTARGVLQPMLRENADPTSRQSALTLLNSMRKIEEQLNRLRAATGAGLSAGEPNTTDTKEPSLELFLRKPEKGERRVQGFLNRVECGPNAILFSVDAGGQMLKLETSGLERVRFVTYTPEVRGEISCGPRRPANAVVVTYRPAKEERSRSDGEMVIVEFIPADFQLLNPE